MNQQVFEPAMRRSLELALNGPAHGVNPQVGAVILDEDLNIIAEGWHQGAGTPHAEVMALRNLSDTYGSNPPASLTAVVTLEPCNHTGRTGPCSQALIAAGISRVVYASQDPGDISGNGADSLREAGVEVISGLLSHEADLQLRVWLTANRNKRTYVTLKWASSLDGRNAAEDGTSQWISGPASREHTHITRSQIDAIAVGTGTVLADNPELTARKSDGSYFEHQPIRVVIGQSELPSDSKIFNDKAPAIHLQTRNLEDALTDLWARGVKHLLVEGGPTLASQFERENLVDEYQIYLAPALIGGSKTALTDIGVGNISEAHRLEIFEIQQLGNDLFLKARRA
ncbi:MAG: bifunctional diaminohydroxyphosphoribosylaminopyrimidine [Actinomycetota bacterium]|jgi:diaminohydroxyphosphoribosylaminopyrimidine deaminase/5-amino-6-(5-phosphoribosylamino)uracil reductase